MTSSEQSRSATPVVLSWGLGVDSSAILAEWLTNPSSRDFDLADLIVLVAMTGDEHVTTEQLATDLLLPLLRQHQVRLVQVARGGPSQTDGIVVLDDSRSPTRLHMRGPWTLSDELRSTGTVPQVATGRRLCSIKFKGWVLDTWIAAELGERPFRHVLGFNDDEHFRVTRDQSYSTELRQSEYPLLEWGWGRKRCEDYLREMFGVDYQKSCCIYCPFAGNAAGLPGMLTRWRAEPAGAVAALMLEHVARALNPASTLFGSRAAIDVVRDDGAAAILTAFETALAESDWALYRVRRIIYPRKADVTKKGPAWRSVTPVLTGDRDTMAAALEEEAGLAGLPVETGSDGIGRVWLRRRGETLPATEEMLVVAPATVPAKERAGFPAAWARLVTDPQLDLFQTAS